jgi:hypothetical protein
MKQARETRARERNQRPDRLEERLHDLNLDIIEARELVRRVLAAQLKPGNGARERELRRDGEADRRRLESLMDRLIRDSRELERDFHDSVVAIPRGAISPTEFQELVTSVRRRSFAEDQLSVLRIAARTSYFTCDQLRTLVRLMSFSDGQEQVAVLIYPRLVDPQRFHTLADAFQFSSTWRSVCTKLGIS